jgi:hypothetical protein
MSRKMAFADLHLQEITSVRSILKDYLYEAIELDESWGEAGADAYTICKLMGHSNILVSQRYVHPTPERLEAAFAALDAYNQDQTKAAKEKAEKKATANAKTLAQSA